MFQMLVLANGQASGSRPGSDDPLDVGSTGDDVVGGAVVLVGKAVAVVVGAEVLAAGAAVVLVGKAVAVVVGAEMLAAGAVVGAGVEVVGAGAPVAVVVGEAVGVAVTRPFATVKVPRRLEVVPCDHVSTALMLCDPSASFVVSYGSAVPSVAVPAKSKGGPVSVRVGILVRRELST
jgi:hypothetical protein